MSASTAVSIESTTLTPPLRGRLDSRNNALNLFRLALASSVFISHSFSITATGPEPTWANESIGGWAVIGFFVISGYLITASRIRSSMGTYLVQRIARIFPAFLVCMIITVVVFAPVAFLHQNGTLSGYLTTPNTPVNYVFANAGLRITDFSVAGTLATVPYPMAWNGPLWTLYYEFIAYLIVGFAAVFAFVRKSPWPMAILFAITVALRINLDKLNLLTGGNGDVILLTKLVPYFLGGALVYMLKDRIPLRWWLALPSLVVGALLAHTWTAWGGQLAAPLFAIAVFWFASWCPSPAFIQKHDVSYGLYIYAWPVQQLLALAGVHERGLVVFNVATGLLALVLATASWLLLERPVMQRVRRSLKAPAKTPGPVTEDLQPAAASPRPVPAGT